MEMSIIGDETMLLKTGAIGGADTFLSNTHLREAEFASKKSIIYLETNHVCQPKVFFAGNLEMENILELFFVWIFSVIPT